MILILSSICIADQIITAPKLNRNVLGILRVV